MQLSRQSYSKTDTAKQLFQLPTKQVSTQYHNTYLAALKTLPNTINIHPRE